jgi:hypothetical protein
MLRTRSRRAKVFLLSGGMVLTLIVGCSGNQNEDEFLRTAPPGTPSEFPNESFGDRRARTLRTKDVGQKEAATKSAGAKSR